MAGIIAESLTTVEVEGNMLIVRLDCNDCAGKGWKRRDGEDRTCFECSGKGKIEIHLTVCDLLRMIDAARAPKG